MIDEYEIREILDYENGRVIRYYEHKRIIEKEDIENIRDRLNQEVLGC